MHWSEEKQILPSDFQTKSNRKSDFFSQAQTYCAWGPRPDYFYNWFNIIIHLFSLFFRYFTLNLIVKFLPQKCQYVVLLLLTGGSRSFMEQIYI